MGGGRRKERSTVMGKVQGGGDGWAQVGEGGEGEEDEADFGGGVGAGDAEGTSGHRWAHMLFVSPGDFSAAKLDDRLASEAEASYDIRMCCARRFERQSHAAYTPQSSGKGHVNRVSSYQPHHSHPSPIQAQSRASAKPARLLPRGPRRGGSCSRRPRPRLAKTTARTRATQSPTRTARSTTVEVASILLLRR